LAEIKSFVKPQKLFRYRSIKSLQRELTAIEQGYLYCSSYNNLNDPMEGLYTSSNVLRESEDYRTVRQAIHDDKVNIGICSLSETHDHELMWAHYADQFAGICIEYNLSRLLTNLPKDVDFVRMFYDERGPTVYRSSKSPTELAKMVLSYKNYRWLYEREWRMFADRGKIPYSKKSCVTRVYLGYRMKAAQKREVQTALEELIPTSVMSIKKYSIHFG
jgi:hypothetical protein